jgi:hypothetical protein
MRISVALAAFLSAASPSYAQDAALPPYPPAAPAAKPQEGRTPGPRIVPPATAKPCVCTTWAVRMQAFDAGCRAFQREGDDIDSRLERVSTIGDRTKAQAELAAIRKAVDALKAKHERFIAEGKALIAEMNAHDAKHGEGVRHSEPGPPPLPPLPASETRPAGSDRRRST